ncbi:hypothetical protein LJB77_01100 [Ruminococcaceae bacterium OttesenSCG-928-N02]|nr:hypothetical protein [Ruminococcaceae bacterium OttesenSCG-928-N02]
MNRFAPTNKKRHAGGIWATALTFALACAGLLWGAGTFASANQTDAATLEQAITRAAVHCYALEGAYPPDMAYLQEHYALQYNQQRFIVDYQCFAQNLMPDITVLVLGGDEDA